MVCIGVVDREQAVVVQEASRLVKALTTHCRKHHGGVTPNMELTVAHWH